MLYLAAKGGLTQREIDQLERDGRQRLEERYMKTARFFFQERQRRLFPEAQQFYVPETYSTLYQSQVEDGNRNIEALIGQMSHFFAKLGYSAQTAENIASALGADACILLSGIQTALQNIIKSAFRGDLPRVDALVLFLTNYVKKEFAFTVEPNWDALQSHDEAVVPHDELVVPEMEFGQQQAPPPMLVTPANPQHPRPLSLDFNKDVYAWLSSNGFKVLELNGDPYLAESKTSLAKRKPEELNQALSFILNQQPELYDKFGEGGLIEGYGIKKRIRGGALAPLEIQNKKYFIDMTKLNNGVICVQYVSSKQYKMRPTAVSAEAKDVVLDIVHGRFQKRIYDVLSQPDKEVIHQFIMACDIKIGGGDLKLSAHEEDYKQYQILCGQLDAGNDAPEIKTRLKMLTLKLMKAKRISRNDAMETFMVLS